MSDKDTGRIGFRMGHGRAEQWQDAVEAALRQMGDPPVGANLGFVYMTDWLASAGEAIVGYLQQATGVEDWVGSVGVGILATGIEYFDEPAVVVMLASMPEGEFQIFSPKIPLPAADSLTPAGHEAAHLALVHAGAHVEDLSGQLQQLAAKLSSGYMVGGITSSRTRSLHFARRGFEEGMSGVVFSSGVEVAVRLTQGCSPMRHGPARETVRHRVTAADGNVIISLDGRPALDVLCEDIGATVEEADLREIAHSIHVGLPVRGSDTRDYLVRNLLNLDATRKRLAIGDYVENDQSILFCRRDVQTAHEDLLSMLDHIQSGLAGPPRGGLYFSCLGRGERLFGRHSAELSIISERLGDVPLAGFFCNGEIAHNRLYGYTGVMMMFT